MKIPDSSRFLKNSLEEYAFVINNDSAQVWIAPVHLFSQGNDPAGIWVKTPPEEGMTPKRRHTDTFRHLPWQKTVKMALRPGPRLAFPCRNRTQHGVTILLQLLVCRHATL
jgi:hypothetical protein